MTLFTALVASAFGVFSLTPNNEITQMTGVTGQLGYTGPNGPVGVTDAININTYGSTVPNNNLTSSNNIIYFTFNSYDGTVTTSFTIQFHIDLTNRQFYASWDANINNLPNIQFSNITFQTRQSLYATPSTLPSHKVINMWYGADVSRFDIPTSIIPQYTGDYLWGVSCVASISESPLYEYTYDSAYNDGYQYGKDIGYQNGYNTGKDDFINSQTYQDELEGQYQTGYQNGKNAGYNEGINTQTYTFAQLFGAIADTPILILRNLLGFDVFGVNAMAILMSMLTGAIVLYLIKKIIL